MPNVLNCSSYKKVGLFLFLRNASRSKSLEIRSLGGPNGLNAGVHSVFCSGNIVCQAFVFNHRVWAVQRSGVDLFH